jgi:hypothetical protein
MNGPSPHRHLLVSTRSPLCTHRLRHPYLHPLIHSTLLHRASANTLALRPHQTAIPALDHTSPSLKEMGKISTLRITPSSPSDPPAPSLTNRVMPTYTTACVSRSPIHPSRKLPRPTHTSGTWHQHPTSNPSSNGPHPMFHFARTALHIRTRVGSSSSPMTSSRQTMFPNRLLSLATGWSPSPKPSSQVSPQMPDQRGQYEQRDQR